jgi:DNA-binding NarL/FixJ family response regulator
MLAYSGRHAVTIDGIAPIREPAIIESPPRADEQVSDGAEAAVPTWIPVEGDAKLVTVINARTLGRETLTRALRTVGTRFRSQAFASIEDWLRDDPAPGETSVILLGIGSAPAEDPLLQADLDRLVRDFPKVPTIVMGDIEDPAHVVGILTCGARGYIPTSVSLTVAVGAISLAQAGGVFAPASSLMLSHAAQQRPLASATGNQLFTERQAEVAEAISRGKANKIIAYELNLCESTVKVHVRSVMKKLQAQNRTEVAFKLHSLAPRSGSTAQARLSVLSA